MSASPPVLQPVTPEQTDASAARVAMPFDWRNPDYISVFKQRAARLAKLRADPAMLAAVRQHYRNGHIDDFINDWGVTVDPRVASKGRSPIMPMILWPKQRAFIKFLYEAWRANEPATTVKSRDVGISWLAMGFSVGLCEFFDDISIGFGSEKEDKVDRSGDPDCLFYKGRMFLSYLPAEFRSGWDRNKHSAHMRLTFPMSGSSITGEAGNNIGRGGRKALYFVDESAHIPNPKAIDASLSATTDCRIDMSSVNGMANSFAERAHNATIRRFDFHFADDPRKDAEWERRKREELDPVIFEAEYGCNFTASVKGVVIPAIWVSAAKNAHKLLGLEPSGAKSGALDVADSGTDKNAFAIAQSFVIKHVESWRGSADLDIFHTVERAFLLSDLNGLTGFHYDGDGLGAGVRGDARKINEQRETEKRKPITVGVFRGSGELYRPEALVPGTESKAEDFFENAKAQAWWHLKMMFQYTYRVMEAYRTLHATKNGETWEVDLAQFRTGIDLSRFISIDMDFPEASRLVIELSQPVWDQSKRGKVMVDKCPKGTKQEVRESIMSPNLADSVMMLYAPRRSALVIHASILSQLGAPHAANR